MVDQSPHAKSAVEPVFHRKKTTKPKLRDGCQFLAWLTCEEPEKDACFYDYCNGHWGAAKSHAEAHWNAGHCLGCFEVMVEDFQGIVKIVIVNVRMEPRFEASAKQDPLKEESE